MVTISGGDKLGAYLATLSAKVTAKSRVDVGFLAGADYPDGTPVAAVAAWQNYGTRTVPATHFFDNLVRDKAESWGVALAKLLQSNEYDAANALALAGEGIEGQLKAAIVAVDGPALSPITLMLRKMKSEDQGLVVTAATVGEAARRVAAGESPGDVSAKRLIETAHMLDSTGYRVE